MIEGYLILFIRFDLIFSLIVLLKLYLVHHSDIIEPAYPDAVNRNLPIQEYQYLLYLLA